RSYAMDDGRFANNGWLQVMPDPFTKMTWDNPAMMGPTMAKSLGVDTGDLIQIAITDAAKDESGQPIQRELGIAACVAPGHAANSITIPLRSEERRVGKESRSRG